MVIRKYIIAIFIFLIPFISVGGHSLICRGFDSTAVKGFQYFKNKGIIFDSSSNAKLYNEVYDWLGAPYVYGGKTKAGADCSGFASAIYKTVYSFQIGGSAGDLYKALTPVEKSELKEGDLVFFKINHTYISHVGVYLSNNKFIHETSYGRGVMISDLDEAYFKLYYYSAARIPFAEQDINSPSENQSPKQ
jgi:murein DD-endopeptidase / murein LD-carboxypeptidase